MTLDINSIEVLLFDLGGVIVPWVGIECLSTRTGLSKSQIIAQFSDNPVFRAYEIGACEDDVFVHALNSVFKLGLSTFGIKSLWNSWVKPPFPNTEKTLKSLRRTYKTACLSNTNALHWAYLQGLMDLTTCFDMTFASQIIGSAKPDPEIYAYAIRALNIAPERILFFDDTICNVEAAQLAGLQSVHIDRTVGVIPKLKELGII